jgi:uncharacterized protein (DUF2235 family)
MTTFKRIITCSDGTWNKPNAVDKHGNPVQTNVQKIFDKIALRGPDNTLQIRYYDEGIGAQGRWWKRIFDGATGEGIDENILDAYKFIVWNYEPGDEIYLFGFSRGAYTARSVAGLIKKCGIIKKNDLNLISTAYALYRDKKKKPGGPDATRFREEYSHNNVEIKFIGVWDTVGARGIPLRWFQWYNDMKYSFYDTRLSDLIHYAYHALAIDERRGNFKPALWDPCNSPMKFQQILEQRWFAGVHSNVGGGYPDEALSNIALEWLMRKAEGTKLAFYPDWQKLLQRPPKPGVLEDSRKWYFRLTPAHDRPIASLDLVDESVHERMRIDPTYRPKKVLELMAQQAGETAQQPTPN